MKINKKICKGKGKHIGYGCGKDVYLFSFGLCFDCYKLFQRMSNNTETSKNGTKIKAKKVFGEKVLFDIIFEERSKVSEVSGKKLILDKTHPKFYWQFSHILSKGAYPKFRVLKENIKLVLPEEHELWEHKRHLLLDKAEWKWVFDKEEELKIKYFKK